MIYMAADLHLIRYIWRDKRELDGDSYRALNALVDAIIADPTDESKSLILAGDVFEQNRIDGQTLAEFTKALDRLSLANVETYFIQGQHDRNYPPHAEVQGAVWLEKYQELLPPIDGRLVCGRDWRCREELHELLTNIPACDLLVLHASFEHMIHFEGAADLSLADIPAHVKNILVGDIHQPELVDFRAGWCLSPGPLHACNIAQGGPKYFWRLPEHADKPEPVEIPSRSIYRLVAAEGKSLTDQFEQLLKQFKKESLPPIVELCYSIKDQEEVERLMLKNKGKIVFFTSMYSGGRLLELDQAAPTADIASVDMPQVINDIVTAQKDPELNRLLLDLWDGNAVELVQQKIKACEEDDDPDPIDLD